MPGSVASFGDTLYYGAEFEDVIVEGFFVDGLVLDDGTAIVNGLYGKEQQPCDVGSVFDSETYECEGAQLCGQGYG